MTRKLRLGHRGKLLNDVLESLQAGHAQLVTVIRGGHEGHPDQIGQMQHQEITWKENDQSDEKNQPETAQRNLSILVIERHYDVTFWIFGFGSASCSQVEVRFVCVFTQVDDTTEAVGSEHARHPAWSDRRL